VHPPCEFAPSPAAADLVSVVMPAFNAERHLDGAIDAVQAQGHPHWELLLVDDGSTDATALIARQRAARDDRIRILTHDRQAGVAQARNTALETMHGKWVAFLDVDDRWHPAKLQAQLRDLEAGGYAVGYSAYRRLAPDGRVLGEVQPPATADVQEMLRRNRIGHLTGIYRRDVLPDLRFEPVGHEDHVFWTRAVEQAGLAHRVGGPLPLADYLVHASSLSANKWRAARWQWRNYRRRFGLGRVQAARCFAAYVWHALRTRLLGR